MDTLKFLQHKLKQLNNLRHPSFYYKHDTDIPIYVYSITITSTGWWILKMKEISDGEGKEITLEL